MNDNLMTLEVWLDTSEITMDDNGNQLLGDDIIEAAQAYLAAVYPLAKPRNDNNGLTLRNMVQLGILGITVIAPTNDDEYTREQLCLMGMAKFTRLGIQKLVLEAMYDEN